MYHIESWSRREGKWYGHGQRATLPKAERAARAIACEFGTRVRVKAFWPSGATTVLTVYGKVV